MYDTEELGPVPKGKSYPIGTGHGGRCPCTLCSTITDKMDADTEQTASALWDTIDLPAWAQTARVFEVLDKAVMVEAQRRVMSRRWDEL